jgi:hypothetical protein
MFDITTPEGRLTHLLLRVAKDRETAYVPPEKVPMADAICAEQGLPKTVYVAEFKPTMK